MKFATVGDNCVDAYEALEKYYAGGNPVNVAVYLRRLGEEASYTGAVGDDPYGKMIVDRLQGKGVDTSHVKVFPGKTAVTKVELVDGDRVFGDYEEGVLADFKLSEEDINFLCSHDLIISGIWGMIEDDLPKLEARGVPIAFDFSDQPTHPIVDKAIGHVTYAFFSSEEKDNPDLREFMKRMHDKGPKLVVITMGAGDSYIAGFLRGMMRGEDIPTCMRLGAENSSVTISYQGAW